MKKIFSIVFSFVSLFTQAQVSVYTTPPPTQPPQFLRVPVSEKVGNVIAQKSIRLDSLLMRVAKVNNADSLNSQPSTYYLNPANITQSSLYRLTTDSEKLSWNNKEAAIIASNTTGKYWNGYKNYVTLNTDSITQGSTKLFSQWTGTGAAASIAGTATIANPTVSTSYLSLPVLSGHTTNPLLRFYQSVTSTNTNAWIPLIGYENISSTSRGLMEGLWDGSNYAYFRFRHATGFGGVTIAMPNQNNNVLAVNGIEVKNNFVRNNTNGYRGVSVVDTVNQTTGGTGIVNGVYVNQNLTSVPYYRAFQADNAVGFSYFQNSTTSKNYFGGQVAIGDSVPDAKLLMDVKSTTKAVGFPRQTTTQRNAITGLPKGAMVIDTTLSPPAMLIWDGAAWKRTPNYNDATPSNGQFSIGNGAGFQLGNITSSDGALSVANSAGGIGLTVSKNPVDTAFFDDGGTAKTAYAYRNGNTVYGILNRFTGESQSYSVVTTYYDGQTMTDSRIDSVIYRKKGTEYFKLNFTDKINVRWFGAVGDGTYINYNVGDATYGSVFLNSQFTLPATDDTYAFQKAWDFCINYANFVLYRVGTTNSGYRSRRPIFYIPHGSYYLTSSKIFEKRSNIISVGSSPYGVIMQGDGTSNTTLLYNNSGTAYNDFLFYDNNFFPEMTFRDFSVKGTTGNEQFFNQRGTGATQNWSFDNISMFNYSTGIKVNGSAGADKILLSKVQGVTYISNSNFFVVDSNSQSIEHNFYDCNIVAGGVNSNVIYITAGGLCNFYGGTYIVQNGSTIFKVNSLGGSYLATYSLPISTYGTKIEVYDSSRWIDINTGIVTINNEKTRFINKIDNNKIIIRGVGKVYLNNVSLPDAPKFGMEVTNSTYTKDYKPLIVLNECTYSDGDYIDSCYKNYSDINNNVLYADVNVGSVGRVIAYNGNTSTTVTNKFNDGSPNANYGFLSRTYQPHYAFVRASSNLSASLPSTSGGSMTATIPIGTVVKSITIVKDGNSQSGAQAVQKWNVVDGLGNNIVSLTTSSANQVISAVSDNLWKNITSEALRTFTLTADPGNSNHYAQGYLVVEYF